MGVQRDHKASLQIEWEILVCNFKENRPEDYSARNLVKVGVKKYNTSNENLNIRTTEFNYLIDRSKIMLTNPIEPW